jgi:hypothetical protein
MCATASGTDNADLFPVQSCDSCVACPSETGQALRRLGRAGTPVPCPLVSEPTLVPRLGNVSPLRTQRPAPPWWRRLYRTSRQPQSSLLSHARAGAGCRARARGGPSLFCARCSCRPLAARLLTLSARQYAEVRREKTARNGVAAVLRIELCLRGALRRWRAALDDAVRADPVLGRVRTTLTRPQAQEQYAARQHRLATLGKSQRAACPLSSAADPCAVRSVQRWHDFAQRQRLLDIATIHWATAL